MSKVSIVTTVKAPLSAIFRHVDYHFDVGVFRIYVFLDDPDQGSADAIRERYGDRVMVHECRPEHWQGIHSIERPKSVEERQRLNADHALSLARRNGEDWIAHIDVDEFIHLTSGNVASYLQAFPDTNVVRMGVLEAIPILPEPSDLFDIRYFKALPFDLPLSDTRYGLLSRIRRRLATLGFRFVLTAGRAVGLSSMRHGFHYYYNAHVIGKCITRVTDEVESLRLHFPRFRTGVKPRIHADNECLMLHFESCSVAEWIAKWRRRSSNEGFAAALDERQKVIFDRFVACTGEQTKLEDLYKSLYLYSDRELRALRLLGLVEEIDLTRFKRNAAG